MTGRPITALMVEDNAADARVLRAMMVEAGKQTIQLDWIDSLTAALAWLEAEQPDVILLDLSLPESQGLETFERVHERAAGVPIVMLTGLDDEALEAQAMRRGAQDYLVKGKFDGELLVRAVRSAIERKEAEKALQQHAHEQAALYAVTSAVSAVLETETLLQKILDTTLPVLDAQAGWVALSARDGRLRMAAWRGLPDALQGGMTWAQPTDCPAYRSSSNTAGDAAANCAIVACPYLLPEERETLDLESHACIPLTARGQCIGVLTVGWVQQPPSPLSDRTLLLTIGNQVGLALQNAQLYEQARQVDRLQILSELDQALAATLDPARVAEIALQRLGDALQAPRGLFVPLSGDSSVRDRVLTLSDGWIEEEQAARHALWSAFVRGQPASPAQGRADGKGTAGILEIEITGDGECLARLVLAGRPADRPFSDDDRALAQTAAGRVGQAIRNAQLYAEVKILLRERQETQARMIHGEKMAALGRLTASIAHEINNPLQSVLNCLNLVQEDMAESPTMQDAARIRRYLDIAEVEIQRIASIVRHMRDFYRPAAEDWAPTDIHEVLDAVLRLTEKQLQRARVSVEHTQVRAIPPVPANADQLKQLFLNLVLNAVDAMPQGGVLRVTTDLDQLQPAGEDLPQSAARIEFADTGQGMIPELQEKLFAPFFTTKKAGSGLGLYISQSIVQAHGGEIRVESEPDKGTTFAILLPIYALATDTDRTRQP